MFDEKIDYLIGIAATFGLMMVAVFGVIIASLLKKPKEAAKELESEKQTQTPSSAVGSPEPTLKESLGPSAQSFWGRLQSLLSAGKAPDFEAVEEILYTSDLGPQTVQRLLSRVNAKSDPETILSSIRDEIEQVFEEAGVPEPHPQEVFAHLNISASPAVWMIVGVNGAGKTTSIGKIAAQLALQGKRVLVAAGDTFRAAAGEQLRVWTERAQSRTGSEKGLVEIFDPDRVTDPSAVAYDAAAKGKSQNFDVVLIDTAGRLHNQSHLMDELKKVKRVLQKQSPDFPHETLLVVDANNGQNALVQGREFHQALQLTGVVLTKMDGTAKGGVVVGITQELKVPVRLLGLGEKIGDLKPFSPHEFVNALLPSTRSVHAEP